MKLTNLFEAEGPNRYFEVNAPFSVYYGGGFMGPYRERKTQRGDEIHWLHGGMFHIRDGKSLGHIQLTNPDDYSEGEFHAARNNPVSWRNRTLNKLLSDATIEEFPAQHARKVEYNA